MDRPETFTTGEVARRCGVNFRTVSRWIERGLLQAYKLPGRGDRRVASDELARFMRAHHIPDRTVQPALPRRVLIVDDEPAMAHAMARLLRTAGFETAHAANGFEAGTLMSTFKPDLMILDLCMPGMDGIAVLRFLNTVELPAPTKILVVSGDTESRLQEALALGADGILRKPFANEELLAEVEKRIPTV